MTTLEKLIAFILKEEKRAKAMTDEEYEREFDGVPEYMAPPEDEDEMMAMMLKKPAAKKRCKKKPQG